MILNLPTIVAFFLSAVGGLLAVLVAFAAMHVIVLRARNTNARSGDRIDERVHLLALLVGGLTLVQSLSWPTFYWVMRSYVAPLAGLGVMCVFGVTRIEPALVLALQVAKPLLLLALGLWWVAAVVDRHTRQAPLLAPRLVLAVLVAGPALFASGTEAVYLTREKAEERVTCCTQFLRTETATLPTQSPPVEIAGIDSSAELLAVYLGFNAFVIAGCILMRRPAAPAGKLASIVLPAGLALAAIGNLIVSQWAWLEVLAPHVLQLPYHHCLYELLTDTPALGPAAMLTLAGNACLLWPVALVWWRSRAPDAVARVQRRVYELCAVALTSALLIEAVHLV